MMLLLLLLLLQGFAVVCADLDDAIAVVDTIAPEHLEVQVADADAVWRRVSNYGGMFIGENTAEVGGWADGRSYSSRTHERLLSLPLSEYNNDGHGSCCDARAAVQVFGDYGAGPNHVLPTSGTARYTGGLSVFTFLVRAGMGRIYSKSNVHNWWACF